jgi:hypothetical protein
VYCFETSFGVFNCVDEVDVFVDMTDDCKIQKFEMLFSLIYDYVFVVGLFALSMILLC